MLIFSTSASSNANLIVPQLEVHSIEVINPIYIIKQARDSGKK
jgi:hypothetical protein